ncbi:histidine kinase [Hymenobacter sp. M29]|uniref:histidine kinase n=1 Tax=Hymenobacter mellowenesis TaxID=3063995 RepID=A0ABT9A8J2_9BACT|nr:sensor histidine kinase [Hymenobacter sp. M29]MDO7845077.1 histidine kinase [Hymenobacter sp. M29]
MRLWRLLLGILALLLPGWAAAQTMPAAGWQAEPALGRLMLRRLAQTPDGMLWAGTDEGVYRFDGSQAIPLNALRRGGPALPPVPCNALLATPDGCLWLGTDNGLYHFSPTGTLRRLPLPASGSQAVPALALAADGRRVWVGQGGTAVQSYTLAGQPTGPVLPGMPGLSSVLPAPDGSLWLSGDGTRHLAATGRVLGAWAHTGRTLRPVLDPAGHPWLLSDQAAYRAGAGGRLEEVLRWEQPGTGQPVEVVPTAGAPTLLSQGAVRQLAWTPGPAPRPRVRFALALPPWPTANWSGRLWADHAGHWWVFDTGTRGCWQREAAPVFIRALAGPGGRPYSVRASVRLPDGRLLVSSYETGLLTQAADSPLAPLRRWAAAMLPTGNAPVLLAVLPGPRGPGSDWLAAGAFPFLRFNPRTGRFQKLPVAGQTATDIGLRTLVLDSASGRVWAGTQQGLYYYDPAAQAYRPYAPTGRPPLAGRVIEDIRPDGRGHLWLATPEGVEHLTLATGAREVYGPAAPVPRRAAVEGARCLYLAPDGRLWVGTRTHGLAVVEADGRIRAALTPSQGLPSASVASILPGPGGFLWLGTYQGLVRYQPATGQLLVFTTAHGLVSDEFNANAACLDPRDGSLLLGGVAGLHRIVPGQVPAPPAARPRLLLTALTALSASAEASRTRYLLGTDAPPALRLAPEQPLIDLHLALANSADGRRARFAYRVRGWLADRWLGLGTTPRLRLQGLPPGQYTVEIKAATSQGVAAANILRLPLTVSTPWWNRPVTWVLAALAASAAVYGWQRGRLRQLRRENALRARLAADLHDEVGTLLTRVTMQAELLRELEQGPALRLTALAEDSRAAASTVRDIIWSVDAEADTLAALVDRIRDHVAATARATGRDVEFDGDGLPADGTRALPPAVRQHTYRIYQEALTNALKYSPPGSLIVVGLRLTALLELTVTNEVDATLPSSRAGQGLRNLRQRADLLRAELAAGPVPGGWQVRLRVLV